MRSIVLAACFVLVSATEAMSWGASGHSIVGELAERRLKPAALQKLKELLGGEVSLASLSSWADDFKNTPTGSKTRPWHYVDIDVGKASYSEASDCPAESCLPKALKEQIAILSNVQLSPWIRRTALLLVVHLVGDMTQPFHCTERNNDNGGGAVNVDFEGNGPDGKKRPNPQTNLHAIWDESLIDAHAWSWGAYTAELEASTIPMFSDMSYQDGSIENWINDCHSVGRQAYALTPEPSSNGIVVVDQHYQAAVQPILDRQLAKGGLQLAAVLNAALGP